MSGALSGAVAVHLGVVFAVGVGLMAMTVGACCVVDWWTHERRWRRAARG